MAEQKNLPTSCPNCHLSSVTCIGRLPAMIEFAGRKLASPIDGGSLFLCSQCGLEFRYPVLEVSAYEDLYDNGLVASWGTGLRSDQRIVHKFLCKEVSGGSVLDYGCYIGQFLGSLPATFQRFGVKVNAVAAARAGQDARAVVWHGLEAMEKNQRFDAIVCMDVVEHFRSPLGTFSGAIGEAALRWCSLGDYWRQRVRTLEPAGCEMVVLRLCRTHRIHLQTVVDPPHARSELGSLAVTAVLSLMRRLGGTCGRVQDRGRPITLPGIGLTRDHLFIVLRKG